MFIFVFLRVGNPFHFSFFADRNAAIRGGIGAILVGENPVKKKTFLGNNPSILPFTYIFYLPIYLLTGGHIFFMNIIVLIIFCIVLFYNQIDTKQNFLILPIMSFIVFSEYFFLEVRMNSDLITANLLLCLILLLIPEKIPKQKVFRKIKYITIIPDRPSNINRKVILFAIFFGCLLAMRIHFWLIGPIIALYICKIHGIKRTAILTIITIGVFLIVMLPFMLQDLDYFINVNPIGHNSDMFANWRNFTPMEPFGFFFYICLKTFLIYGRFNSIIISCLIISFSLLIGFVNCKNKFHLILIISLCFFVFLLFFYFIFYASYLRDYISIAAIPLVFSFLHVNLEKNNKRNGPIN